MTKFEINNNDDNQTIFKFIKKSYSSTPLSVIYKWFRKGDIKINGKRVKDQKYLIHFGDIIEVYDTNKPVIRDNFKYIKNSKITIAYEDKNLIIVNKEPDVEMHSPINISLDDLVKSYLYDKKEYNPKNENSFVISHVHRLDKLTSGLVIYAKNKQALDILSNAIKNKNEIEKYYLAKTLNKLKDSFITKGWIKYDQEKQISIYTENNKSEKSGYKACETHFKLVSRDKRFSVVEAQLITGRKHQIRATLAFYGFPIVNDFRYGGQKLNNDKMIFLSAYKLVFKNLKQPLDYLNGVEILLESPLM